MGGTQDSQMALDTQAHIINSPNLAAIEEKEAPSATLIESIKARRYEVPQSENKYEMTEEVGRELAVQ